jgi:hypothetical protein
MAASGGNNAHQPSNTAKEYLHMSFKTTVARLAGRRFARVLVGAAAIGAVTAGITAAAAPALADTPQFTGTVAFQNVGARDGNNGFKYMCLDANSQEAHIFGGIIQWDCNTTDAWQNWTFVYDGNGLYQLQNQADGYCLDADADNAGTGGSMVQWTCNPSDAFQQFYITNTGDGLSIKSVGASNLTGTPTCVDANYYQQYELGEIQQYPCDTSDTFQLWTYYTGNVK